MKAYLDIVSHILENGERKSDRTGTGTLAVAGVMFEHDMATGFPLLTSKRVPFKLVASELEFFIKGITDKQWLIDRNNHIWDEWCNPTRVPYGHGAETKARMMEERDLGAIYGFQWRHFGATYRDLESDYTEQGIDQLQNVVEALKNDPTSRRMMVSAWNPISQGQMALPACHYGFQVTVIGNRLNLMWNQRSVDTMLGLPFNIASYGLLLHLLSRASGFEEGRLVGFLGDVHIYDTHVDGARLQLSRADETYPLPRAETECFDSLFDWNYTDTEIRGYRNHPSIKFEIAV